MMANNMDSFCGSRHNSYGRFIEACLLCLLKEEESYGYSLMENLSDFGFIENEVDISTIYRQLRSMEKEGLVVSAWRESHEGPRKRVYNISDLGIDKLDDWVIFLLDRKKRISSIVDKYNSLQNKKV